jgi:hypothetical protein
MHRTTQITVTLAAALVLVAGVAVPAAAQSDAPSALDELVGDGDGYVSQALDTAQFSFAYARASVSERVDSLLGDDTEPTWSASATVDDLHNRIDSNRSAYQSWLNERLTAADDRNTLQIRLDNGTETDTLYLVASNMDGAYQGLAAVETAPPTIDESCTLSGAAGANAPAELDTFYSEAVEPGTNVSTALTGRLAASYQDDVDCTFIGS